MGLMKWFNGYIVLVFCLLQHMRCEEILIDDEIQAGTLISDLATKPSFIHDRPEGRLTFQLLSGGTFVEYLHIDVNTGKLFSKKKIDRDSLCSEIEVCCKNEKPCSISISVAMLIAKTTDPIIRQILINIEDKNDHRPIFDPLTFNISTPESSAVGSVFQLPLAIDRDSDMFSVKAYKMISKNDDSTFSLETQSMDSKMTAYLRLKSRLDREELDHYTITIAAIDGGPSPFTGTLIISITVLDINDNPPIFEHARYSVTVKESTTSNDPITTVVATDKDIGENADIFYKLDLGTSSIGTGDMFRVDLRSGAVYMISQLDYEKQQNYKLIITASNRTPGVGTATATLTVSVINLNDEKPIIFVDYLNNLQHALITEHALAPKFVSIVSVSDKDIGVAGKVTCRLENEHELFDLRHSGQDQYKIHTRQPLDRETKPRYSLTVVCVDHGTPSMSVAVVIPVIIIDENDNKPEINSQSVYHISENKNVGTFITKIVAIDKDDGLNGQLTYSISDVENRITNYISIDSLRGTLKTVQIIDREATNPPLTKLDFIVTVSDSGTPRQSTMKAIQLIIDDENDNAPQFAQNILRFSVSENEAPIYRLGQIEITDPDEIGSIRLTISYDKLNYRKCPFSLTTDKNGFWLMTTESLNWEAQPSHELIIVATDGVGYRSHTTTANVHVTVIDVNETPPVFIFPRPGNRTFHTVSYRQSPGFVLLTVSATDKDNPANGNGKIYFRITEDLSNLFNIETSLGRIRIHRQMTLSDIGDHYISVRAEDHGSPSLSSDLRIKIKVTDSPIHFNEKGTEYEGSRLDAIDTSVGIFNDRESIFVFGLVLILLIFMICVCFVIYVRHMKGWLAFLPDLISICRFKDNIDSVKEDHFNPDDDGTSVKYCSNSNYYAKRYVAAAPPNFPRNPDMYIKNGRDCYEVLKCPQEIQHDPCQMPIINEQQYNDLASATMMPTFHQDSYLTLHQYPHDYPMLKDNVNISNFNKFSKPQSIQSSGSIIPSNVTEKIQSPSLVSSKASYAVSFPTEQSTFV